MQAGSRRQNIIQVLRSSSGPVSAGRLAGMFGVSRQIIVGDIALLRASGTEPVVRVMVEAETDDLCREYVDRMVKVVENNL